MSSKSVLFLASALVSGLALGPVTDAVSAEPGHDILTSIVTPSSTIEIAQPALEAVPVEPIAPEAAETTTAPLGSISTTDLECMAKVIDHEAGNQPREGQLAVAHVMINRVKSGRFPNSLCGVAYQRNQFSFISQYQVRPGSLRWANALDVARAALSGEAQDTSKGALFFHARRIRPNSFFQTRTRVTALEDHIFYR